MFPLNNSIHKNTTVANKTTPNTIVMHANNCNAVIVMLEGSGRV